MGLSLLRPVARLFRSTIRDELEGKRRQAEAALPKVRLEPLHIARCRLLLDRRALLRELPRGGVGAEIGVNRGDFTEAILDLAAPRCLHLVDPWESERYHDGLYASVQQRFASGIAEGRVRIHRKRSVEAAADFDDGSFDWIYLDTTHAYALTARELRAYAPKIKPGGCIAGHDYSMGNWVKSHRYGVIEAVHEFCVQEGWELACLTVEPLEKQSFAIRRIGEPR